MPAPATAIRNLRINWSDSDDYGEYRDWSDRSSVDYAFSSDSRDGLFWSERNEYVTMNDTQKNAARLAFELWDDTTPLSIQENSRTPEITFAHSTALPSYSGGHTDTDEEYSGTHLEGATIEMNANGGALDDVSFGSFAFKAYLHEIGHSLGLTHPGHYDASDSTAPTFSSDRPYDTEKYTVMSYFGAGADGSGTNHTYHDADGTAHYVYASTPLLHDIAAMQAIYGVDTDTRATDHTVYGFHGNAGKIINGVSFNPYSFDVNPNPVFCIWDAGGENDTIDASGFTTHQRITLEEGAFSSISQSGELTDNVSIAFGARIENAIGGSGDDDISGNASNNVLDGGGGNDTLWAGVGVDTLKGGAGNDNLWGSGDDKLQGGADNDTYHVTGSDIVTELAGQGTDTVYTRLSTYTLTDNVENLTFVNDDFTVTAGHTGYGNARANTMTGADATDYLYGYDNNDDLYGGGGSDYLYGGVGADHLVGGAGKDTLSGGAGIDTFVFTSADESSLVGTVNNVDAITDFVHGTDKIDLRGIDANAATLTINENFTFLANRADFHGTDWTGKVWFEQQATYASDPFGDMGTTPLFATTTVYASTDADSAAEFQVTLTGLMPLTISDFLHPAGDLLHI